MDRINLVQRPRGMPLKIVGGQNYSRKTPLEDSWTCIPAKMLTNFTSVKKFISGIPKGARYKGGLVESPRVL